MHRRRFRKSEYRAILKRQRLICACGCGRKLSLDEGVEFNHGLGRHADDAVVFNLFDIVEKTCAHSQNASCSD